MQLDTIKEEEDDGPSPEDDIDDDSGVYKGSSGRGAAASPSMTCSRPPDGHENTESELMVCPFLGRYHLACLSTLRLHRLPPTRRNPSKYGYISIPCQTTRSPFHSMPGTANNAYGLRAL
jgi:hypothetical protein